MPSTATRPTALLPPAAVSAMARLELAFAPTMSAADRAAHEAASYVRRPATPAASDDHGKTKDPLPQRPRGPHPQTAVA
jgi:hypothetical protein